MAASATIPGVNANKIGSGTYLKLEYGTGATPTTWEEVYGLQDCPDLGGTVETVEVTTFADPAHRFMQGILNYGQSLTFTILHSKDNFTEYKTDFNGLTEHTFRVTLPDGAAGAAGTTFTWPGKAQIAFGAASVNGALVDKLTIVPTGAMTIA